MKTSSQPKPDKLKNSVVEMPCQGDTESACKNTHRGFVLTMKNIFLCPLRCWKLQSAKRREELTKEQWQGQWKEAQKPEDRREELLRKWHWW